MGAGGSEHQFWLETERQDTILHPERSGEDLFRLGISKPSVAARQTVSLFSKHKGKVFTGNSTGEEGAVEGFIRWSLPPAEFETVYSTGVETCLHT